MKRVLWLWLAAMLILAGCAGVPAPPPDHFYRLPPPQADNGPPLTDQALLVPPFGVTGLLYDRAILFVRSADSVELRRYDYHYWHMPPERLLQQHLAACLESAAAAPLVMTERIAPAELTVAGRIDELLHVRDAQQERVVVDLELRLLRRDRAGPVLVRRYRSEQPVSGPMPAVIEGFGRALDAICAEFLADARRAVAAE